MSLEQQSVSTFRDFLTVSEAAQILGVCTATLRQWDRTGKLKSVRHPINGYRLYRRVDLDALLQLLALDGQATPSQGA